MILLRTKDIQREVATKSFSVIWRTCGTPSNNVKRFTENFKKLRFLQPCIHEKSSAEDSIIYLFVKNRIWNHIVID